MTARRAEGCAKVRLELPRPSRLSVRAPEPRPVQPVRFRQVDGPHPSRPARAASGLVGARRVHRIGPAVDRPSLMERMLVPGWPLKYLLVAFPLWWVLGLTTLIFPLLAVPMVVQLRRMRPIAVPPWFGLWFLFLIWQLVALFGMSSSPPGTYPGSVLGRLISVALGGVEYAGVTATLLYVGNLPRDPARGGVSQAAIARWMGWLFLTVLAGGFLGVLSPNLQFSSLTELLLPRSVTSNAFVRTLIHPVAAQVQSLIGTNDPRPAAPFGYTNLWGNAISIVLVWFVAAWVVPGTGWRRWLYAAVAATSTVPIIVSLNRGLWIGIGATVVWILLRELSMGKVGRVLAVVVAAGAAGTGVALSPLAAVINERLNHGASNDIRAFVAHLSVVAIQHSPVFGYGGVRHAIGSPASIAVGPSPRCGSCGGVPTGSTGDLWSVLFNQGIVGALLYFGFFAMILATYWRARGIYNEAALVTVALVFVYMLFYSCLPVAPTLTMIAVGVLWRGHRAPEQLAVPGGE